jgi:hypothetical protein
VSRHLPEIRLRPVTEADLGMFRRFVVEPGLIGLDWSGFSDPKAVQRRFDADSYLGADDGRLIVDVATETDPGWEPTGLVSGCRGCRRLPDAGGRSATAGVRLREVGMCWQDFDVRQPALAAIGASHRPWGRAGGDHSPWREPAGQAGDLSPTVVPHVWCR